MGEPVIRFITLLFPLFASLGFSAVPQGLHYQALVRNSNGDAVKNQTVTIRVQLRSDSAMGAVIYTETHSISTGNYGNINLVLGKGTTANTWSSIDWSKGSVFLSLAVDLAGGSNFTDMGTSQLWSVPFAHYSDKSGSAPADGDADPSNELQTLTRSNDTLRLSRNGGTVKLPGGFSGAFSDLTGIPNGLLDGDDVNDNDSDPTNELQTLSLNSQTLSISGKNSVTLPVLPKVAFSVHSRSNQSISSGSFATIRFEYIDFDEGSNLSLVPPSSGSSYYFTAPVAGVYHFEAMVTWEVSTQGETYIFLYRGAGQSFSKAKTHFSHASKAGKVTNSLSLTLKMAQGDFVFIGGGLNALPNSTTACGANGSVNGELCYFTGFQVY